MKTFKGKQELISLCKGRKIYVFMPALNCFILVTLASLKRSISAGVTGEYEFRTDYWIHITF